jgi:hypothetical protein
LEIAPQGNVTRAEKRQRERAQVLDFLRVSGLESQWSLLDEHEPDVPDAMLETNDGHAVGLEIVTPTHPGLAEVPAIHRRIRDELEQTLRVAGVVADVTVVFRGATAVEVKKDAARKKFIDALARAIMRVTGTRALAHVEPEEPELLLLDYFEVRNDAELDVYVTSSKQGRHVGALQTFITMKAAKVDEYRKGAGSRAAQHDLILEGMWLLVVASDEKGAASSMFVHGAEVLEPLGFDRAFAFDRWEPRVVEILGLDRRSRS